MTSLDRGQLVELLGRLSAADDQSVLDAARTASQAVTEAGLTWDDILRAQLPGAGGEAADESASDAETEALVDAPAAAAGGAVSDADKAEAHRLIARLLADKKISETLREELTEMKRSIAEGEFDAMDSNYVRALARRLGA